MGRVFHALHHSAIMLSNTRSILDQIVTRFANFRELKIPRLRRFGEHYSPPLRNETRCDVQVTLANDERNAVQHGIVDSHLRRQAAQRIAITLQFESMYDPIDYCNVHTRNTVSK